MQDHNNQNPFNANGIYHDIKNLQLRKDIRKEYRDLKDFYLNDEKKDKLKDMSRAKRFFFQTGYLFVSIFQKLNPLRKLLVFIGLLFLFFGKIVIIDGQNTSNDSAFWGGLLIFFVLVLELKDKLLAVEELVAGKKIQKALLPEESPDIEGWDVFLFTTSANEVSGDLVDYLHVDNKNTGITIADVAGKGLSAALLTAKLQATVRAFADTALNPSDLAGKTNKIFNRDSLPNIFASMIYLEISSESNKINFANAGHLPPLIISETSVTELEKGDAALGLFSKGAYRDFEITLENNQTFIAYSDGLTEAINELNQFYGKERLFSLLKDSGDLSTKDLGRKIILSVEQFRGEARVSDDLSLVILKKK